MTSTIISIKGTKVIYFLVIASLVSLVKLRITSNTIIFDYINIAFIMFFLTYFLMRAKLNIPLLVPVAIIMIGSLISMFDAQVPLINSNALVIDLYLFAFFIVLYNIVETKEDLGTVTILWMAFAAFQGVLMICYLIGNFDVRHTGTFLNPNMVGSYLGLSFFLLFQPFLRIGWMARTFYVVFILGGIIASKSISTFLSFMISSLAIIILYWSHIKTTRKVKLTLTVLVILVIGIASYPHLGKIPNLFGRLSKSSYGRSNLWKTGISMAIKNPLALTMGPAGFKKVGPIVKGPIISRRELHSDWLSFLVERGIGGFIGLVLLFATFARMLLRNVKTARSEREFLWNIGLCGMFVFIIIDSFAHEILHYRHVWFAFAIIANQYKFQREKFRQF